MENQSKAVEFIFQDTQIHFLLGNEKNVMVNATEMAKVFGKRTGHFLQNETTKAFIERLKLTDMSASLGITNEESIIEFRGRNGIYFNRILALKFAAWLDLDFEIWVYAKIEEVLFGKAKDAGERISELSIQEAKVKKLQDKIWKSDNELAKSILKEQNELKRLKNSKIKAVNVFVQSNQVSLFDENLN